MNHPAGTSTVGSGDVLVCDIVAAVSEAEDEDAGEMAPPLDEVIDLDALGRLLEGTDDSSRVTFRYRQSTVEVGGDGVVQVTDGSAED